MANRLSKETSPYLLQHKNNPVDWYPWGSEAIARAKKENKPILLSIGYSACHWCHVMAHESFEDPEIALIMNDYFVNIKVDREERPDLDQIYQNVAQAITQGGGWPLTVFLLPDLRPFYGGTYFPPEDRYGRPGFSRVLLALSRAFNEDQDGVLENAKGLMGAISQAESIPEGTSKMLEIQDYHSIVEEILNRVDWENGGLGSSPKFPNAMIFTFLWRFGLAVGHEKACEAVLLSLAKMARGGIYDQLGGGFHRYSVDESWSIPHFEKMLYDNALLLKLYSEVLLSGADRMSLENQKLYREILVQTSEYVFREMTDLEGAFYSAQDADSEGEEGKFFVWGFEELVEVLTPEELRVFTLRYGVTEDGNFEHATSVLYTPHSQAEVAAVLDSSLENVEALLDVACEKLRMIRARRVHPGRDEKILTSWSALMVSGLAWAAQALSKLGDLERAGVTRQKSLAAYEFLKTKLSQPHDRLLSTFQMGKAKGAGYLDDYAFLSMAALDLSRFADDQNQSRVYVSDAQRWIDVVQDHFHDSSGLGYYFTSDDHEALIQRPKTLFDQAIPSGTAVVLACLRVLSEVGPVESQHRNLKEVEEQLGALSFVMRANPYGMGELLCSSLLHAFGPVLVSGEGVSSACCHPHVFQAFGLPGLLAPLPKGHYGLCQNQTCSLPTSDLDVLNEEVLQRVRS